MLLLIHFKGVVLELLAPICKTEKSGIHSRGIFPLEASFSALDGVVDRLATEAFLPWSDSVCPLPTQASYSSLRGLPLRCGWRYTRGRPDGIKDQFSSTLSRPLLDLPERLPRMFLELGLLGKASTLHVPILIPECSPDCSGDGES